MKKFYFILAFAVFFLLSNKVFSQVQISERTDRTPTEKQAVRMTQEDLEKRQQIEESKNSKKIEEIHISIKAKKEMLENTNDESLKFVLNEEIQSLQDELKATEQRHKVEIISTTPKSK